MQQDNTIHIAYALDDNFLEYTCVSVVSLLSNTKRSVTFHILESNLSDKSKNTLCSISKNHENVNWVFHHLRKDEIAFSARNAHLTDETYYRFLLPSVCSDINKILYIDGDTIVNKDIAELYDIELGAHYAAAVYEDCPLANDPIRRKVLEFTDENRYFQAGVLLLNLSLCREAKLYNRAMDCIPELKDKYEQNNVYWMDDQEVFNYLIKDNVKFLPPKYNFTLYSMGEIQENFYTIQEWTEAINDFVILHNCGRTKPVFHGRIAIWNPEFELYYQYKDLSPFADLNDKAKMLKYRLRDIQLEQSLILCTLDYINYKKYTIFETAAEMIKTVIGNRKLIIWGNTVNIRLLIIKLAAAGLAVDSVVDGLAKNQGKYVFDYVVDSPDLLSGGRSQYFVVISMMQKQIADKVKHCLFDYGYGNSDILYVFDSIYRSLEE